MIFLLMAILMASVRDHKYIVQPNRKILSTDTNTKLLYIQYK